MSQLVALHSADLANPALHVVFVHGLQVLPKATPHHRATWMADESDPDTLWPHWLTQQAGCAVWLYNYPAHALAWFGDAMSPQQQGTVLLSTLAAEPSLCGQPLLLVGHSLGGLVIKHALCVAEDEKARDTRLSNALSGLTGIAFVACPHHGAQLASLLAWGQRLTRATASTLGLVANNDTLQDLNRRFNTHYDQRKLQGRVFYETSPTSIRQQRTLWGVRLPRLETMIVSSLSADPGLKAVRAVPVAKDHNAIAQCATVDDPVYKDVLSLVNELLPAPAPNWPVALQTQWAQHRQRVLNDADGQTLGRFIKLSLLPVDRAAVGTPLPPYDDLSKLFADNPTVHAWLLTGDPGAGKSTLLRQHELQALAPWLNAQQQAPTLGTELCVAVELRHLQASNVPSDTHQAVAYLDTWLAQQWESQCQTAGLVPAPPLQAVQQRASVRWLLDGLNEISADNEANRGHAVAAWSEWLARRSTANNSPAPLFTVRVLNHSQSLSTAALTVRRASVNSLNPAQIEAFCEKYFGHNDNPVWLALQGQQTQHDPAEPGRSAGPSTTDLQAFFGNPFNLHLQCQLFEALGRVVLNRADLLAARMWQRLTNLTQTGRDLAPNEKTLALLDTNDRSAINNPTHWRQAANLWHLPTGGLLVRGLDALGHALHTANSGAPGDTSPLEAQQHLHAQHRESWWQAVLALDVLVLGERNRYKFRHHLHQEFFAARHLALVVAQQQPPAWPSFAPPALAPHQTLAVWEPLPLPQASRWEEAARMAVQMALQMGPSAKTPALPLLQRMVDDGNLPMAARAMAASAAVGMPTAPNQTNPLSELALRVQRGLIDRSQDSALPLRQRLEAGFALGDLGDRVRYQAATGPGGVETLLPKPEHWASVDAGVYPVGDEAGETVTVQEAFTVAFAPVTNAEFACFVQAGGYGQPGSETPPPWWPSDDRALAFWRGRYENEGLAAALDLWRGLSEPDFNAEVEQRRLPDSTKRDLLALRQLSGSAYTRERKQRTAVVERPSLPESWRNAAFNNGLQPVVGVSFYEALAYASWLNHVNPRPGWRYALPTCAHWEAAARGTPGRAWPWHAPGGADGGEQGRINHTPDNLGAARVGRTSPVALWPEGATPHGVFDLAGQVWEWSCSPWSEDKPHASERDLDASALDKYRAVRGGSWYGTAQYCRPAIRDGNFPSVRNHLLGFRLFCLPHSEP